MITPTWSSPVRFGEAEALRLSTPAALAEAIRFTPQQLSMVDGGTRLTLAELGAAVAVEQARLREAGVRRGDVVCAQLPNWWETVAVAHAVWGMGAVLCPVPVNFRTAELTRIFEAVDVAAILVPATHRTTDHSLQARAAATRAGIEVPVLTVRPSATAAAGERWHDGEEQAAQATRIGNQAAAVPPRRATPPAPELEAGLDDVCVLMFTSGTTGVPKGVLHSHRTLLADAWSIARLYSLDSSDRVYMPSPVGHITGLVYGVMMPLLVGGSVVLQADWDAAAGVDLIEEERCTFCVGATPFLRGLTDEYSRRGIDSALRGFACGGADVPAALVRRAEKVLGASVARAYGLTEMPTVTCGGPADPDWVRAGTDGRLTGTSEARLAEPVVDGVGELEVRGPELCLGYLDPAHTRAAFTSDGWFRTGDLARVSDGTVTISGRAKDIIVRGGENIGVKEVEDYLLDHPGVSDVAVVGVPDDVLGERAAAFVVPGEAPPTLAELSAHLLGYEIAKHKLPEYLLITDRLPRTESGKVQKFVLRELAAQRLAAGEGERR